MNRHKAALLSLISLWPVVASAEQVPAIQANASASASTQIGSVPSISGGSAATAKPPGGWPPLNVTIAAPAIALDKKENTAATMSASWRNKNDRPSLDSEGVLRWVFGNSQTRVVCAPLNICDIELKPGETINNIRLGDTGFWNVTLAISGSSEGRVTHVAIAPKESGRSASMLIYTDQRTYSIKLVSTPSSYTAITGFTYPDPVSSSDELMANYRIAVGAGAMKKGGPVAAMAEPATASDLAHLEILKISGDNPSWRPTAAYTDGRKTYIQFPSQMQFSDSPTLLGINSDGGWFSAPSERRVIYRWMGDRMVADTVMDKLALVLGVGSTQQKVVLERHR